jgi:peptidoglycan/LPS O-acetylase OafA/YrhL
MLIRTKISVEKKRDSSKIKFASCLFLGLIPFALEQKLGYLAPTISVVFFALLIQELVKFELSSNRKIPENISSFVGSMSYGLYVWHVPVASLISVVLIKANRGQSLNYLFQYFMLSGCTLIVSFFSIMYFEKPIQRLAQKKMNRFFIK